MATASEKEYQHVGECAGAADHDFDLVKDLGRRLEALWHYDQYIANAEGRAELQQFWRETEAQNQKNVKRIKDLIAAEVRKNCF